MKAISASAKTIECAFGVETRPEAGAQHLQARGSELMLTLNTSNAARAAALWEDIDRAGGFLLNRLWFHDDAERTGNRYTEATSLAGPSGPKPLPRDRV